jgi:hypothetical protein
MTTSTSQIMKNFNYLVITTKGTNNRFCNEKEIFIGIEKISSESS